MRVVRPDCETPHPWLCQFPELLEIGQEIEWNTEVFASIVIAIQVDREAPYKN